VVHVLPPRVTVCVTVMTETAGGEVVTVTMEPVVVDGGGDAVVVTVLLPLAKALARNLSNVLSPYVGAFTANTIP
jgi:hypothetical protein